MHTRLQADVDVVCDAHDALVLQRVSAQALRSLHRTRPASVGVVRRRGGARRHWSRARHVVVKGQHESLLLLELQRRGECTPPCMRAQCQLTCCMCDRCGCSLPQFWRQRSASGLERSRRSQAGCWARRRRHLEWRRQANTRWPGCSRPAARSTAARGPCQSARLGCPGTRLRRAAPGSLPSWLHAAPPGPRLCSSYHRRTPWHGSMRDSCHHMARHATDMAWHAK